MVSHLVQLQAGTVLGSGGAFSAATPALGLHQALVCAGSGAGVSCQHFTRCPLRLYQGALAHLLSPVALSILSQCGDFYLCRP